jgi:hypothetical protein
MALLISDGVIEADVVHLVRDPRATTHSWQHRVHTNDDGVPFFNRRGTLDAVRHWILSNLQSSVLRWKAGSQHAVLLRYEDLMAAPQSTLGLLFSNLGLTEVPQVENGAMAMPVSHTLYGNPSRFDSGRVILEVRQEWLSESGSALAWNLPLIMTEPLSWWFGYHLLRRRQTTGRGPDADRPFAYGSPLDDGSPGADDRPVRPWD